MGKKVAMAKSVAKRKVILLGLLILACSGLVYAQSLELDPPVDISDIGIGAFQAVSQNRVYRVSAEPGDQPLQFLIMLFRSVDSGQTWEDPREIGQLRAMTPSRLSIVIAAAEENVYVAYRGCTSPICPSIPFLLVSNDWGDTFERRSIRGSFSPCDTDGGGLQHRIWAFGSNLFLAWNGPGIYPDMCYPYRYNIYLASSSNGGRDVEAVNISMGVPASTDAHQLRSLLGYGDEVYVFWTAGPFGPPGPFMRHATIAHK